MKLNPYSGLPDQAYWRRAVASVPPGNVNPSAGSKLQIAHNTKIATAGSCFAQHIARYLMNAGYSYLVTEPAHPFIEPVAQEFQYGLFTARFGNIYTTRQLFQLIQRAYGLFLPTDDIWQHNGRFYDPYRQSVQPNGFASEEEYRIDRTQHFDAVRRMFEQCDVFIFTLGLTEGWENAEDGAAYPMCPGVIAGTFDPQHHQFRNLNVEEVCSDLRRFLQTLYKVNSAARVVLTVSPVPLVATMQPTHVLTATTYSKSVLRVAADMIATEHDNVEYFPSYEIVTGSFNRGAYFEDDLRSVRAAGVDHVMRCFFQTYAAEHSLGDRGQRAHMPESHSEASRKLSELLCDEERLGESETT